MSEINDPGAVSRPAYAAVVAAMGMREVAWAAVRERQRASDLPGLILAQMALELIDAAAHRRDRDVFLRARSEPPGPGGPSVSALTCVG